MVESFGCLGGGSVFPYAWLKKLPLLHYACKYEFKFAILSLLISADRKYMWKTGFIYNRAWAKVSRCWQFDNKKNYNLQCVALLVVQLWTYNHHWFLRNWLSKIVTVGSGSTEDRFSHINIKKASFAYNKKENIFMEIWMNNLRIYLNCRKCILI